MKNCYRSLVLQTSLMLLLSVGTSVAQTSWNWSNPRPQGGDLFGVTMKLDSVGVVCGASGTTVRRIGGSFQSPIFAGGKTLRAVAHYVDTIWAAGDSGAVYRSTDDGITWQNKSTSYTKINFYDVYAYDKLTAFAVGDSGYVVETTNGGTSWTKQTNSNHFKLNDITFNGTTGYCVGPNGQILVGTSMGLFGWIAYTLSAGFSNELFTYYNDGSDEFAVGDNGYYHHLANSLGATSFDTSFGSGLHFLSLVYFNPYIVIVGRGGVILRSADKGVTWSFPNSGVTTDLTRVDTAADPQHPGTLIAVGLSGVILRSSNYGSTWVRLDSGSRAQVLGLAVSPNGNYYGSSNLGGLYSSSDQGTSWRRDSLTSTFNQLYDIQFQSGGFGLMATNGAGVLVTKDSGATWTAKTITGAQILGVGTSNDSVAVAVGAIGTIYRTINKGATWTAVSCPTNKTLYDVDFYGKYGVACGYGGALLYTHDAGATWTLGSSSATGQLNRVRMSTATNALAVGVVGNMWRTSNGGANWSSTSSGTTSALHDIAWHDDVNGLAVGDGGLLLRTTNFGTTWTSDASHTTQNLYAAMIPTGTNAFVGGDQGVILQTANSQLPVDLVSLSGMRLSSSAVELDWQVTNQRDNASFLVERQLEGWGYVGEVRSVTANGGLEQFNFIDPNAVSGSTVYRITQLDLSGVRHILGEVSIDAAAISQLNSSLSLWPNPASDQTSLRISLKDPSYSSVTIYDLLGKAVYSARPLAKIGANQISLSLSGLAAGVYRVVIDHDGARESIPLTILR